MVKWKGFRKSLIDSTVSGMFLLVVQCLLDNLLGAVDENGQSMSREALRDELMTLLVAAQETSAILLAWTCAYLAHHPEVQARAAQEVMQVKIVTPALPLSCQRQLT